MRGIGGAFEIGTCLPSPRRRRGSLAVVPRGLLQQVALAREKSLQAVHVPAVAPLAEVAGEVARVAVTGHSTRQSRRRRSRRRPRDPCESRVRRAPRVWREERRGSSNRGHLVSLKTLQERIAKTDRPPRSRIESSANEETKFAREPAVGPPPTTVRGTIKPRRAAAHERERGTRPRGGRRHPGVASIVFHDEAAELVGPVGPAGGFERAAIHPGAVWMSLDHREASSSRLHLRRKRRDGRAQP